MASSNKQPRDFVSQSVVEPEFAELFLYTVLHTLIRRGWYSSMAALCESFSLSPATQYATGARCG